MGKSPLFDLAMFNKYRNNEFTEDTITAMKDKHAEELREWKNVHGESDWPLDLFTRLMIVDVRDLPADTHQVR